MEGSTMLDLKGGVKVALQGSAMTEVKNSPLKIN